MERSKPMVVPVVESRPKVKKAYQKPVVCLCGEAVQSCLVDLPAKLYEIVAVVDKVYDT